MSNPRIKYVLTCGACPEQYDAYIDGEETPSGYLRLRHGVFRVEYLGNVIYKASPEGDGCFDTEERDYYLEKAARSLISEHDLYKISRTDKSYWIEEETMERQQDFYDEH